EVPQRREGLQTVKRQVVTAQLSLEVEPGRESTFAGPLRVVVHDGVEDLQAVMAHAQTVGVRKGQAQLAADLTMVLDHAMEFTADVLSRRLHLRQEPGNRFLEGRIQHGNLHFGWKAMHTRREV